MDPGRTQIGISSLSDYHFSTNDYYNNLKKYPLNDYAVVKKYGNQLDTNGTDHCGHRIYVNQNNSVHKISFFFNGTKTEQQLLTELYIVNNITGSIIRPSRIRMSDDYYKQHYKIVDFDWYGTFHAAKLCTDNPKGIVDYYDNGTNYGFIIGTIWLL
jgi:hypothetical protein